MNLQPLRIPGPALIGFDHVFDNTSKQVVQVHKCTICGVTHTSPNSNNDDAMMGLDFLGL